MQYRQLGQTGLKVSVLGFGCGAVGGLLVKGERDDMLRAVAHAIELGVTYFDTAPLYGNGQSETNLGWVLEQLKADVIVGTKVHLKAHQLDHIKEALIASVESSLQSLKTDCIDLIQLHNGITTQGHSGKSWITPAEAETAIRIFEDLQAEGKIRFWGFTGLGDTDAIHQALTKGVQTVQSCYNLINPSAGIAVRQAFPFQDYEQLIDKAAEQNIGVIVIRALAAGALSGSDNRHANAAQNVAPISSGSDFDADVAFSQQYQFLVDEGYAENLAQAALRFVISNQKVSTTLVGISNLEQLEQAVYAINKGALPDDALQVLRDMWDASIS